MSQGEPEAAGSRHFVIALRLAASGWLGCLVLQAFLYARPGPYGGPFLLEWRRYAFLAAYYDLLGVWLLSAPFLLLWLMWYRRTGNWRGARLVHRIQAALLTFNLLLSQLDHEVLRFLGIRLGLSFLATYARSHTLGDSLFADVLLADAGGALLPLVLLILVPGLYASWAMRLIARAPGARCRPAAIPYGIAVLLLLVPLAAPANGWRMATSQFRLRKVEPVVLALATDAALGFGDVSAPDDLRSLVTAYQARWLDESDDKAWRFADPAYPYLREPTGGATGPAQPPWNVILIQLETLRGVDVGFLGSRARPSATPYLDSLATSGRAAAFSRALSFGPPSINGIFAGHCSVAPHSRRYVTAFVATEFHCLPGMLRRYGYRAEMFNAGDTDWDGATYWLTRWYDRLWRYPEAKEHDRPVFRAAARRIRALGRSGRPFLATIVSVSNHTPFLSRETRLDIAEHDTPQHRIRNTTRYTDDVVAELLGTLEKEPWFAHTIVVIFGDHGFNLGEHDQRPGQQNLYRESVWVPLLFLGAHPRLPRGVHHGHASLLDITPTVADLLGIREANPWQGHSLLAADPNRAFHMVARDLVLAEDEGVSGVTDPVSDAFRLFDRRHDWLQNRPLPQGRSAAAIEQWARRSARLNDHLLRSGAIWPAAGGRRTGRGSAPPSAPRR
ncbi:LTA synthase family protein [Sphingomonas parva]|uniref:LTA synthase family protein n=1 Tax=Sphingomonas parva TaxID=2555898 RepID=A0A4Y8ZTY8_9SPHN|nr:LTA synthase family protein [Sphingomonas parva]TFI58605.1 LTA synthase family protein [Sphingomonas parva]